MSYNIIYFDNNSTTQTDPRVVEEMLPYFTEHYGNPSSVRNKYGFEASAAVNLATRRIRDTIGNQSAKIIYTSGATESINMALTGTITATGIRRIITSPSEHSAVLDTCKYLESLGVDIEYISIDSLGMLNYSELEERLADKRPSLVTLMGANNEIGVTHDLLRIRELCTFHKAVFHSDCTQLYGKTSDFNLFTLPDLVSLSAHKFYGPKGIGSLFINSKSIKIEPLLRGGGQQDGLRAGTLPVPLIVGIGKACEIAHKERDFDMSVYYACRNELMEVMTKCPEVKLNGSPDHRIPNNLNFLIEGIDSDTLITELKDFALSSAAACESSSGKTSHVLKSIGLTQEQIKSCIRIGIGRFNTTSEAVKLRKQLTAKIKELRKKKSDGK